MSPWQLNENGEKQFTGGTGDWDLAAAAARQCAGFIPDDEDEQVADEPRSCYNCRYRRWQPYSIRCLKTE
jgi:hypothetical protein